MANNNRGQNENSKANLLKGSNIARMLFADGPSQKLANLILDEEVEYNGVAMPAREAILRNQLENALGGDLRSLRACHFLIELAGRNEANSNTVKTATMNPLEQLQQMMQKSSIDDRRKKAD